MAEQPTCNSCNRRITNQEGTVRFQCPKCKASEIIRCGHCRAIVAKYTCSKCGLVGPN